MVYRSSPVAIWYNAVASKTYPETIYAGISGLEVDKRGVIYYVVFPNRVPIQSKLAQERFPFPKSG